MITPPIYLTPLLLRNMFGLEINEASRTLIAQKTTPHINIFIASVDN